MVSSIIGSKPVIYVDDIYRELVRVASLFYAMDNSSFTFIGVTGTNGKTTTTSLIYQLLEKMDREAALIGTVHYRCMRKEIKSLYTTPDYLYLKKFFYQMRHTKNPYVVMEVSSHAIDQKRIYDINFHHCIFTNLSHDHLDYHGTMPRYYQIKRSFFQENPGALSFINMDDEWGRRLNQEVQNKKVTYAISEGAQWQADDIRISKWGSACLLCYGGKKVQLKTSLLGRHNIYNLLAAVSVTHSLGISLEEIVKLVPTLETPPGRMEQVQPDVFVDYAHSPDALRRALLTLRDAGYTKLILVFGCGGQRDKGKREIMGQIASSLADFSFITSDNPRSEDPYSICSQIQAGFIKDNALIVLDRREAIRQALKDTRKFKCALLIAGKGHEDYQIIGDKRNHFNDQEVIRELIGQVASKE